MTLLDAAWWVLAVRLAKGRLWRAAVSVFMLGQFAAQISLLAGFDWSRHAPKSVLVAVVIWHFLVVPLLLAVCLPLGLARAGAQVVRGSRPRREAPNITPESSAAVSGPLTRRAFLGNCAVLAPPLLTFGLTGMAQAQLGGFRVRRLSLTIPTLPAVLDGITIAHVTDMHVGGLTDETVLRDMVNTTNALKADLVVMTGDLINQSLGDLATGIDLVKAMQARYGLWMVEGNHDLFDNGGEFERRVKAAGVRLLLDESAVTEVRGQPVQVFGLSWVTGTNALRDRMIDLQMRRMLKQRRPEAFPLLLAHHPHAFDAAARAGLPLTFAGHTHGGYLMLNSQLGAGPVLFRYWSGLYQRAGSQLVVSNGVGNWFPLRINAPAEIVHVTLRCAGAPA
jgi:hypothetical protein